jgi:hypothetical protein
MRHGCRGSKYFSVNVSHVTDVGEEYVSLKCRCKMQVMRTELLKHKLAVSIASAAAAAIDVAHRL